MMSRGCLDEEQVLRYVEGELTRNESASAEAHAAGCANCRAQLDEWASLTRAIGAEPRMPEVDLVANVRARAALPPPRRRTLAEYLFGGLALSTAFAGLALYAGSGHLGAHPTRETAGMQSRGAATPADAWVRLRVFRAATGAPPQALAAGDRVRASDSLLVAYDDVAPAPYPYLMVVGVDRAGSVFWYYPALEHDGDDDRSIAARGGAGIELGDEIRHALKAGPLRLFAVFTRTPLSVKQVEALVRSSGGASALERLPIADSAQHSLLVNVDDG